MDPYHFGKLDPDPDPHESGKLDPDPHQGEKQDPDPDLQVESLILISIKVNSRIQISIKGKIWKSWRIGGSKSKKSEWQDPSASN